MSYGLCDIETMQLHEFRNTDPIAGMLPGKRAAVTVTGSRFNPTPEEAPFLWATVLPGPGHKVSSGTTEWLIAEVVWTAGSFDILLEAPRHG
jgi:hypothetical protein